MIGEYNVALVVYHQEPFSHRVECGTHTLRHRARRIELAQHPQGVALHGEIHIPDGESGNHVADGAAGEVKIHARRASNVLDQSDALELVRRQPDFHGVNVISHSR